MPMEAGGVKDGRAFLLESCSASVEPHDGREQSGHIVSSHCGMGSSSWKASQFRAR
jgi:hypothetical protein